MNMLEIFGKALGIEAPWYVTDVAFNPQNKRLDIKLDFKRGATFSWTVGEVTTQHKAYDTVEKEWRHLNFFEHECYLSARVPRIKTADDEIHIVMPAWSGLQNGFTLLFEALIIQLCKSMPVHQVSQMIKESDYKIWSILEKYVEEAREYSDYSRTTKIGMDETSLAKGHQYISLFVDLETRHTMFVAAGKDSNTVSAFKRDFEAHKGNVDNITDVSCDMSQAFIKGTQENLPKAKITFDKFHVLKLINEAVDKVRRTEAQSNPLLKGTRYVFLKNDQNLTEQQRKQKAELSLASLNLKSVRALNMRESFQQIYSAKTESEFVALLKRWYYWVSHSRLDPMKKVGKTIKSHWDGVVQWKQSQINNGILEGLNSIVQAAKRKARGYKLKHFSTIVYLLTGGLNFTRLNPSLPT